MQYALFLIGVIIGVIITLLITDLRTSFGTLTIDKSNEEKDTYDLHIDDLDSLEKKKKVVLNVKRVSHK